MATVNEAEVKFVADLSNFTAGASQAAGELKSKLTPAIEGINKSAVITAAGATKIKKALLDVGQAGRTIAPLIGGVAGEFISLASTGANAVKGVAASLINILTPMGAIAAATAAAAGGFIYFGLQSEKAAAKAAVLSKTIDGQRKELEKLKEAAINAAASVELVQKNQGRTAVPFSQIPGGNERNSALVEEQDKAAQAAALVNKKIADQAVVTQRLTIVQDQLQASLNKLNFEYNATGDKAKYLEAQTAAYSKALNDAAEIEGVSADTLRDYSESAKVSADSVEALRKEVDALARSQQAIDDQFNPGGSQFQGPLLKDAGPKAATPVPRNAAVGDRDFVGPVDFNALEAADAKIADTQAGLATLNDSVRFTTGESLAAVGGLIDSALTGISGVIATTLITGESAAEQLQAIYASAATALIDLALKSFIEIIAMSISAIITRNIEAYSAFPFVGLALGIAGGVAAVAAARSGSQSAGGKAFAEGGIVTGPIRAIVGEAGPEAIFPLRQLKNFIKPAGGQVIHTHVYLNDKQIALAVGKELPGILRQRGVKG